ncbi:MFS transporter [Nonomuraea turkmeniaca]|uniref:MFS transporter n=1 Tax=Nonomuraea turkmeniaca TaxID=103838 RepID=A0A5S4FQC8_9ACTN|nr:MFS transporter [Nonomuraea turkmeniaca]TMR22898.1 MFS transporter [Nonomuraea turkmeniaca]
MAEGGRGRRATAVLLAHAAATQVITFVLRPTMSYRAIELDVPAALLGLLGASFAIAPLLLALPAGHAADRYGERRLAVAGAFLLTAASVAFLAIGHTVPGLLAAGVLLGTGHLGCVIAQQALVANTTRRGGHDTAFGHYTFAASLGQAAGPVLIAVFGGERAIPDTERIFAWSCGLAALLVVLSALLARSPRAGAGDREALVTALGLAWASAAARRLPVE